MRVRLDSTSCETSLMIFALSLGERVVNHFARRCIDPRSTSVALGGWALATDHLSLPRQEDQVAAYQSVSRWHVRLRPAHVSGLLDGHTDTTGGGVVEST